MSAVEFDEYAANGYDAGMEHPLKRLLGRSSSDYLERKAVCLIADLSRQIGAKVPQTNLRLLDFGCGTGELLRILRRRGVQGELRGCDVSRGMLAGAAINGAVECALEFDLLDGNVLPYENGAFDVVVMSGVLHHIPLEGRAATLRELRRVLAHGGRVYIFEHNPWNFVTRWVVSHTLIDRHAVLASCVEVRRMLAEVGFGEGCVQHLLFFPVRWRWSWTFEKALRWLPLGGQYVAIASAL